MKKALLSALFVPACLLLAVPVMADDEAAQTDNTAPAAAAAATEPAAAAPKSPSGYDWAAEHNITDVKDCTEGDQDFKDGCTLYVQEKDIDEGEKEFDRESGGESGDAD